MGKLSSREISELLSRPIISFITTLNQDGSPHTSPVWHMMRDGKALVATGSSTVKAENIANDSRVSLVVAADRGHGISASPQPWVQVNGKASLSRPDDIDVIVTALAHHYLAPDKAAEYAQQILGEVDFVLIEIYHTRVLGFDGAD
ncbi:MAG TPA: pyridoxamine 5'-phosphate oxidase family protein [Anaerolineales bacterium]|nr:pyridoxamine 5'-phosphate oxidase family protein [Anaerolineales bacterium]